MTHLFLWCRWYSTLCLVLAMPCPFPGLAACGRILTFISTTGPAATDTRSASDPYAQVPAFTICPTVPSPPHTCKPTHTPNVYGHTHPHWHERHILTSSCSTLDQQKGSHTQSERGLWGQGAGFGKQPQCEICRSDTTHPDSPHSQQKLLVFCLTNKMGEKIWFQKSIVA